MKSKKSGRKAMAAVLSAVTLFSGMAAAALTVPDTALTADAKSLTVGPGMFVFFDNSELNWDNVYAYWFSDGTPIDFFGNTYYVDKGKKMQKLSDGTCYIIAPSNIISISFTNGVTDEQAKYKISSDGTSKTSSKAAYRTADYELNYGYGCNGMIFRVDPFDETPPGHGFNITKYNRMELSEYYGDIPMDAGLDKTSLSINAGSTKELTVITSLDGTSTFKSSDTSVATVDSNGKIKGVKAGTAKITAQVKNGSFSKTLTCNVTVKGSSSGSSDSSGSSSSNYDESLYFDNDYELKIKDGIAHTASVVSYKGGESTIVIKDKIKGNKIIGVEPNTNINGWDAPLVYDDEIYNNFNFTYYKYKGYDSWDEYLYYFKEVKLPSTIQYIGNSAFSGLHGLKKINLPEGIKTIGNWAFSGCYNLNDLTIPSTVESLGGDCFSGTALKTLTIKSDHITLAQLYTANIHKGVTFYGYKGSEVERFVRKYGSDMNYSFYAIERPAKTVEKVNISKTAVTLGKGEKFSLTATALPSDAAGRTITWTSSNNNVAKVSGGQITAVSNGTATITAKTSNGKNAKCTVTVKNAPTKITLTKGILTLGVGEKFTVGSGINDGAGCAKRTYRTSNSSIVKMTRTDWNGDFYGVKPGVAYVTVKTYNGKESTCKVTVKSAPASVTISKKTLTLKVGQTATLSCSVPSNAGCATRTFRTSNSNVVKMTKTNWTGSFKAMKKGTAYVTVRTYNGKESACKITVV